MSEVNYRRNGQKYSSSGHCWGLSPKVGKVKVEDPNAPKPKSSRGRRTTTVFSTANQQRCSRWMRQKGGFDGGDVE